MGHHPPYGGAKQTVADLLVDVGQACSDYQDFTLRNLYRPVIGCDEIWSYCYAKQKWSALTATGPPSWQRTR